MAWIEPKTDWTSSSRLNIEDYNRIKNNLMYLYETALVRVGTVDIQDMGEDLTEYTGAWDVDIFNAFENNLHIISERVINSDIGSKKTFYENGPFIDCVELNRIESITLRNKKALDNLSAGLRRIPFSLGQYKTIRM